MRCDDLLCSPMLPSVIRFDESFHQSHKFKLEGTRIRYTMLIPTVSSRGYSTLSARNDHSKLAIESMCVFSVTEYRLWSSR